MENRSIICQVDEKGRGNTQQEASGQGIKVLGGRKTSSIDKLCNMILLLNMNICSDIFKCHLYIHMAHIKF